MTSMSSLQTANRPGVSPGNNRPSLIPRRVSANDGQLTTRQSQNAGDITPPLPPRSSRPTTEKTEFPPKGGLTSILKSTSKYGGVENNRAPAKSSLTVNSLLAKASTGLRYTAVSRRSSDKITNTQNSATKSEYSELVPPKVPPRGVPVTEMTRMSPDRPKPLNETNSFRTGVNQRNQIVKSPTTPEPKPLTRTNVTEHDKIWTTEDNSADSIMGQPVKHITPETTAAFFSKCDALDIMESASDSSADTMIMMTTAEEKHNEERISQSSKKFESQRNVTFYENVSDMRQQNGSQANQNVTSRITRDENTNMINLKGVNSDMKCVRGNGTERDISIVPPFNTDDENNVDDGYGTNSSSATNLSSPLSSSSSSTTNSDMENSSTQGTLKSALKTDGKYSAPIAKPGPQTEQSNTRSNTWAVRRRAKILEAEDNSLQEKLRQLTIIEEEENGVHVSDNGYVSASNQENSESVSERVPVNGIDMMSVPHISNGYMLSDSVPTPDLRSFEGDLCDKFTDMDRNYRNYYDFEKKSNDFKEDNKVLYFHQKLLKQNNYNSNDNYYNPHSDMNSVGQHGIGQGHYQTNQGPQPIPTLNLSTSMGTVSSQGPSSVRSDYCVNYSNRNEQMSTGGHYSCERSSNDYYMQNVCCSSEQDSVMPNKGFFNSVDNVNSQNGRRTLFASSADIHSMFQSGGNSLATQLQRPASYRHSFHAVPSTPLSLLDKPCVNEASENVPRPRASSASVAMQSKSSWNPFGSMFKRKSKNQSNKGDKNPGNQDKKSQNVKRIDPPVTAQVLQTKQAMVKPRSPEPTKPVPPPPNKHYTIVPIIRQPKRQLMRNAYQEPNSSHDNNVMKSQTLPLRGSGLHGGLYEGRFKTVSVEDGDSQKLSTLV